MTWTDASIEALKLGFNAYRNGNGIVRPLVQRYASLPGDWMIDGGRIVSTEPGAAASFGLVMMIPAPPMPDPLETIAMDSAPQGRRSGA
jgi:hypothetical protein